MIKDVLFLTLLTLCVAGVLQTGEDGGLCEAAGGGAYRRKPRLQGPREGPDDVSGHSRCLLRPAGSQREEQGCKKGPYQSVNAPVHDGG